MEQENFSLGHSSTGLSKMISQVVQGAGAHFPCKVVEDAVWEKTGRLGTNFSEYLRGSCTLTLTQSQEESVSWTQSQNQNCHGNEHALEIILQVI